MLFEDFDEENRVVEENVEEGLVFLPQEVEVEDERAQVLLKILELTLVVGRFEVVVDGFLPELFQRVFILELHFIIKLPSIQWRKGKNARIIRLKRI